MNLALADALGFKLDSNLRLVASCQIKACHRKEQNSEPSATRGDKFLLHKAFPATPALYSHLSSPDANWRVENAKPSG